MRIGKALRRIGNMQSEIDWNWYSVQSAVVDGSSTYEATTSSDITVQDAPNIPNNTAGSNYFGNAILLPDGKNIMLFPFETSGKNAYVYDSSSMQIIETYDMDSVGLG
ncbi:MAG: hypothetical protein ACOCWG_04005, partial [bacterium]